MDGETPQPKATDKRRKDRKLQDLQMQDNGGKRLWNLGKPLQGTTGHHGEKAKGRQTLCLCV